MQRKTVVELKEEAKLGIAFFKFVHMNTGEYRYCDILDQHCDLVEDGETAQSAGTVKLYRDKMVMEDVYSITLKLATMPEDEDYLEKAFGVPMKSKWD